MNASEKVNRAISRRTLSVSMKNDGVKRGFKRRIGVAKSQELYTEEWDSSETNAEVAGLFGNAEESGFAHHELS